MTTTVDLREQTSLEIADVWAGTPAPFDCYTHGDHQFVAFYDAERRLTVGSRTLESESWTLVRLPEDRRIEWDAHNSLVLAVDSAGHLHVSGNMHVHPLKYYRTTEPLAIDTLERVDEMVGTDEQQVTYPQFLRGPDDELVFTYRDGYSGGGNWLYNVYDASSREWERLLSEPLRTVATR